MWAVVGPLGKASENWNIARAFSTLLGILASSYADDTKLDGYLPWGERGDQVAWWKETENYLQPPLADQLWTDFTPYTASETGEWRHLDYVFSLSFCGNSPGQTLFPPVSRKQFMFSSNYNVKQLNINAILIWTRYSLLKMNQEQQKYSWNCSSSFITAIITSWMKICFSRMGV